ncbi:Hypothetical predicted protein [Paramuricea clavata]|uniref:Uncharacterized protein n=1 Tax=Paramuricea clavata TaxID=317549 RepID=A0A7D9INF3_PARCT|nr:Hypothetical predicted protein [Paramuricea clavata]
MASKGNKRQAGDEGKVVDKRQKGNDGGVVDRKTVELVRKLFNEFDREKREKNIEEIAKMVVDRNNKQNLSKLADMVKNTKSLYREKRNYNIEDRDIVELAALVRSHRNISLPRTSFSVRQIRTHERFGYTEYIFDVNVGSEHMRSLPDFLVNLRSVFDYLINTMMYYAGSNTDKARFFISNAPRTPFSTAVLNVTDFTTDMFFNIFEKHMQSNAQEIINNGWNTTVSLYIFPNTRTSRQQHVKKRKKQSRMYKYLGKNDTESGSGKKNDVALKHGREVRHGVFQIGKANVKNSCLALALLVGKSYLRNDTNAQKLKRNSNLTLSDLYTDEDITNVYTTSCLPVGPVRIKQLQYVYEKYLKPDGLDLVVFSKNQADSIVYDSRLHDNQRLHRITNDVIFLWLNEKHYDLVTSPYTFSRLNLGKFCFSCMRYFRRFEIKDTHVCIASLTCHRCYANTTKCIETPGFVQQCTMCDIIFYNPDCFRNHLVQRVFKTFVNGKLTMETPCQRVFFVLFVTNP